MGLYWRFWLAFLALLATEFLVFLFQTLIVLGHLFFGRGCHEIDRAADDSPGYANGRARHIGDKASRKKRGGGEKSGKNKGFAHGVIRPKRNRPDPA